MRVNLSLLTILMISSVTSTALQIRQQVRSTSAENTFVQKRKNPEVVNEKLLRVGLEEVLWIVPRTQNDVSEFGKANFSREILSLHTTLGRTNYEETRQLFINNVLTESLDNGEPAYYNSNVLGRYYRKDYFECILRMLELLIYW